MPFGASFPGRRIRGHVSADRQGESAFGRTRGRRRRGAGRGRVHRGVSAVPHPDIAAPGVRRGL